MSKLDFQQLIAAVRAEIAKYYDGEFSDVADLSTDLRLLSDDLTAIALTLEKRLGVKLDREAYQRIRSAESCASEIHKKSAR